MSPCFVPRRSARYYRDALCTLALAHAAASVSEGAAQKLGGDGGDGSTSPAPSSPAAELNGRAVATPPAASSLLWQAAKVNIEP